MTDSNRASETHHLFPVIDRVDVSPETVTLLKSERDHVGLGVDLMIETACYVTIAANILGPDGTWTRDQAAIGGNVVRLHKLLSAVLDQTVQDRRETGFILARLAFETIVTVRFLVQKNDSALIDSYVKHSLDHERRLLQDMDKNIAARHGLALPIEDRMRRSINRILKSSGVTLQQLPTKRERDWGGKNLFEKAEAVGLAEPYRAMFAGASLYVHGAWGDLYISVPGRGVGTLAWAFLAGRP